MATIISEADLAQRTKQMVKQAKSGQALILASSGKEQVAIVDILDYRLLRAAAVYQTLVSRSSYGTTFSPHGLTTAEVATLDIQAAWNHVIAAYLAEAVSIGRAAELLGLSRFELIERFNRLELPLMLGPATAEEAKAEFEAIIA
jgi:hypothetical protein